jgi:hypothetical protein
MRHFLLVTTLRPLVRQFSEHNALWVCGHYARNVSCYPPSPAAEQHTQMQGPPDVWVG